MQGSCIVAVGFPKVSVLKDEAVPRGIDIRENRSSAGSLFWFRSYSEFHTGAAFLNSLSYRLGRKRRVMYVTHKMSV